MNVSFPAWCYYCKRYLTQENRSRSPFLCTSCYQALPRFESSHCLKCGRLHDPLSCLADWAHDIHTVNAVFSHDDPVNQWISSLKYSRNLVAGRMLQLFIKDWIEDRADDFMEVDRVLPIPLHFGKLNERGFNQAVFLLGKLTLLEIDPFGLKKVRSTSQQAGKSKKERQTALKGVFDVREEVKNKRILLFDDVCTTGSTLSVAAKALKRAGARQIDALVLSRSLRVI